MKTIFPLLLLLGSSTAAMAQWNVDPNQNNAVCALTSVQGEPKILTDGNGGVFVTWSEVRKEDRPSGIYVQHVNAQGQVLWGSGGVQVGSDVDAEGETIMVTDGNGGLVITWTSNEDVYAQRLSVAGVPQWTAGGVVVCNDPSVQRYSQIAPDDHGGAFISWEDMRDGGTGTTGYIQHIDATGTPQWQTNGVAFGAPGEVLDIVMTADHAGGVYTAWTELPNGRLVTQRFDATGTALWPGGVQIYTGTLIWELQFISDDNHGAILAWTDLRNGYRRPSLYGQRISPNGTTLWTANGVKIHQPASLYRVNVIYPRITRDGTGGVIAAWHDGRNNNGGDDIYAQRVNGSGQLQWGNGAAVCSNPANQYGLSIDEDGQGGAVVAWHDGRNDPYAYDVYAQQLTASGSPVHTADGIALSTAPNDQVAPKVAYTGRSGRAIIVWDDRRHGFFQADIYATALSVVSGGARCAPEGNSMNETMPGTQLSPNPAGNTLHVTNVINGERLRLCDLYGRVLRTVTVSGGELSIDVHDLAPGFYFIRTESENIRFVKQ